MEEAAEADGVRRFPEGENAVYVEKMVEEAAMFVPALSGTDALQDGDERREVLVNGLEVPAEEGTSTFKESLG